MKARLTAALVCAGLLALTGCARRPEAPEVIRIYVDDMEVEGPLLILIGRRADGGGPIQITAIIKEDDAR